MMSQSTTSLFLSRLILNLRSRQVMAEIGNPYEMHRTLMRAFPKATDETKRKARDEFGVLFRSEVDESRGLVKVYVQSRIEPDWSFLSDLNGYLCADNGVPACEHKDIMPACRNLQNGQVLSFCLRANPTKRIPEKDHKVKGKRIELRHDYDQIDWLERKKGKPGGFEILMREVEDHRGEIHRVPRVAISCEEKMRGRKVERGKVHKTTHFAVLFDGLLRITDADAFRETLIRGIGPAKAFGFGLLSVAPWRP